MDHRFFVDQPIQSNQVELDGAEAHHLLNVLRAGIGQQVTLLDGSGFEFQARVAQRERGRARLEIVDRIEVNRELSFSMIVGVALPKGDRQRWLVEKVVELGVTRLVPLITERGVSRPTDATLVRLRRTVVEASKQCGRTVMMEICEAQPLQPFLHGAAENALRIVAYPYPSATSTGPTQQPMRQADGQAVFIAVGPEGGFTEAEWQALAAVAGHPEWVRASCGLKRPRWRWSPRSLSESSWHVSILAVCAASPLRAAIFMIR